MFYLTLCRRACHLDRVHSSQAKVRLAVYMQHKVITFFLSHYKGPEWPEMRRLFFQEREIWGCKGVGRTAGWEHRENRGRERYGKRDEGFLKEWEAGEIDIQLCKNAKSHYGSWKCLIFEEMKKWRNEEMKRQGVGNGGNPPSPSNGGHVRVLDPEY